MKPGAPLQKPHHRPRADDRIAEFAGDEEWQDVGDQNREAVAVSQRPFQQTGTFRHAEGDATTASF